jgi:hypothetical protein
MDGPSFFHVAPSLESRTVQEGDSASGHKNQIIAKCGNLTHHITYFGWATDAATVSRHGDFILRKMHYPHGPVLDRSELDLGNCRIDDKDKDKRYLHLMVRFLNASLVGNFTFSCFHW